VSLHKKYRSRASPFIRFADSAQPVEITFYSSLPQKVDRFNVSFTPGFSPVIGGWEKVAKPF